jgi:hypothetical protein
LRKGSAIVFLRHNKHGDWITTWSNELAAQNINDGKVNFPVNDWGMYQEQKVSDVEHYIATQMNN